MSSTKDKYHSCKGDMNDTVKNQLLDQVVDERNSKFSLDALKYKGWDIHWTSFCAHSMVCLPQTLLAIRLSEQCSWCQGC